MLINCVAYQDGRKLADIPVADIDQWLGRPDCFVWVALRDASDDELRQMQQEFGLHDLAVEDARHGHQRPKVEEYGDTLFVVMKLPETREGELDNGEVAIFAGRNFVLSVRNRSRQGFLGHPGGRRITTDDLNPARLVGRCQSPPRDCRHDPQLGSPPADPQLVHQGGHDPGTGQG